MMQLQSIAHARAGDKGNLVNISVFAYRDEDYAMLVERVTEERVSELFREHITRPVTRYCVPHLRHRQQASLPACHRPKRDPSRRMSACIRAGIEIGLPCRRSRSRSNCT